MWSYRDDTKLYAAGFTEAEITLIRDEYSGEGVKAPDLDGEAWTVALHDSKLIEAGYFHQNPDSDYRDYDKWRDDWRKSVGYEKDPWIWLDQFYFRKNVGAITRKRWEDAYKKVHALKVTLFMD